MNSLLALLVDFCYRYAFVRHLIWGMMAALLTALGVAAFYAFGPVESAPVGWERSVLVSPPALNARNAAAVAKGNYLAAVYEALEGDRKTLYVSISFNGGRSYIAPVRIAEVLSKVDANPHVAISGAGHVAVIWQNLQAEDSKTRLFISQSKDMGATWSEPRRIFTQYAAPIEMEMLAQVIYDELGALHLFYHAFLGGRLTFFHSKSPDENLFDIGDALVDVDKGLRGAFLPSINVSGPTIYIVWQGKGEKLGVLSDDLFLIKSNNHGRSWTGSVRITESTANEAAPSLAVYKGILYLAYQTNETKNWSIAMVRGFNDGEEWERSPVRISDTNANCYSPAIVATRNDEIVVAWHDTRQANTGIYGRRYSIEDRKLSPELRLSGAASVARRPAAASVGPMVVLFWEEGARIIAKYSDVSAEPPVVFSGTHPEGVWSKASTAVINWRPPADESGILGYATIVNRLPVFNPTIRNLDANFQSMTLSDLEDGVNYFHIRTVDGAGNFSRTIHFRLQVSRNPPAAPVVVSPTHPEGTPVPSPSPTFQWSTDEGERLKGFVFSFSNDPLKAPDQFTTNLSMNFSNLANGRYFFKVRSVDATNTFSRTAAYEIIVGEAAPLDPSMYERMARDGSATKEPTPGRVPGVIVPHVAVTLPFDAKRPLARAEFDALVSPRNIAAGSVLGYAYAVTNTRTPPPDAVNLRGAILRVRDLSDGEYYLAVKARYSAVIDGRAETRWTAPAYVRFTVQTPPSDSPVLAALDDTLRRIQARFAAVFMYTVTALVTVITLGFGSRLAFYARLLRFRLVSAVRGMW